MADVVRTIQATGGNHATLNDWNDDAEHLSTRTAGDVYKGVISDNSNYNEAIVIATGVAGTITSYTWLDVATANRPTFAGYDATRARQAYAGGDTAAIQDNDGFARISGLQINRTTPGSSDECIRYNAVSRGLVERCILLDSSATPVQFTDGVYQTGATADGVLVHNTLMYGFGRCGPHTQSNLIDGKSDYNTVILCGRSAQSDQYGLICCSGGGGVVGSEWVSYNSIYVGNLGGEDEEIGADGRAWVFDGSHNGVTQNNGTYITVATDNSTDHVEGIDGVVDTAPATAGYYITDATLATLDATPVDHANNVILEAGTVRTPPDTRASYATDLLGNARTATPDIGCVQISAAAPSSWTTKFHDGTAEVTASNVQFHDGTSLVSAANVTVAT